MDLAIHGDEARHEKHETELFIILSHLLMLVTYNSIIALKIPLRSFEVGELITLTALCPQSSP